MKTNTEEGAGKYQYSVKPQRQIQVGGYLDIPAALPTGNNLLAV
jgi:hypothetical protein